MCCGELSLILRPRLLLSPSSSVSPLLLSPSSVSPLLLSFSPSLLLLPTPLLSFSPSPPRFIPFRDLNEVITCVALVEPKEGVFKEHIRYVLVITTPMEIVLVGISFEGGDPRGDIVLHGT